MGNCINCIELHQQLNQKQSSQLDQKADQKQSSQLDQKADQNQSSQQSSQHLDYNERKMSNHYTIRYPIHDARTVSPIFRKTRHQLITIDKIKCFICNTDEQLEAHHFYCEKFAVNAIDWDIFAQFAKTTYNMQSGLKLDTNINWELVKKNPDIFTDSTNNMIILCKLHHTSGRFGIHHVPFPDWILQRFAKNKFKFLV